MLHKIIVSNSQENNQILEAEIIALELILAEKQLQQFAFEQFVRTSLNNQLLEIRRLDALFKAEKNAKKDKRLVQKKKGKNYVEPVGIKIVSKKKIEFDSIENNEELKKIYKETIKLVHPDKFSGNEVDIRKATKITTELIAIYKSGDLASIKDFYEYIIFGNTLTLPETIIKSQKKETNQLDYLKKKKLKLLAEIDALENSAIYKLSLSVNDKEAFIGNLKTEFEERIVTLLKRTRKSKNS
jgi:hypothetical protein